MIQFHVPRQCFDLARDVLIGKLDVEVDDNRVGGWSSCDSHVGDATPSESVASLLEIL